MSLHRSLKTNPGALNQHRNVLTRAERLSRLEEQGRFDPREQSPLGLVKVASRKVATKKPKKEKVAEGVEGTAAVPADGIPAAPAGGAAKSTVKPAGKASKG